MLFEYNTVVQHVCNVSSWQTLARKPLGVTVTLWLRANDDDLTVIDEVDFQFAFAVLSLFHLFPIFNYFLFVVISCLQFLDNYWATFGRIWEMIG